MSAARIFNLCCKTEGLDELTNTAFEIIKKPQTNDTSDEDVAKIKELRKQQRETNPKENSSRLKRLQAAYTDGADPKEILEYDKLVDGLTVKELRETVNTYVKWNNYVRCILVPEKVEEKK